MSYNDSLLTNSTLLILKGTQEDTDLCGYIRDYIDLMSRENIDVLSVSTKNTTDNSAVFLGWAYYLPSIDKELLDIPHKKVSTHVYREFQDLFMKPEYQKAILTHVRVYCFLKDASSQLSHETLKALLPENIYYYLPNNPEPTAPNSIFERNYLRVFDDVIHHIKAHKLRSLIGI